MFIASKNNILIPGVEGREDVRISRGFVGDVPDWVGGTAYFQALVRSGKITLSEDGKEKKTAGSEGGKGKKPSRPKGGKAKNPPKAETPPEEPPKEGTPPEEFPKDETTPGGPPAEDA